MYSVAEIAPDHTALEAAGLGELAAHLQYVELTADAFQETTDARVTRALEGARQFAEATGINLATQQELGKQAFKWLQAANNAGR
ncbi:MAG TPA: hypothetical protein VLG11_06005 [Candidatus Saccharimonadales bacterium]|nr:hypothetical protein [Candidatus Saccharimonadales bacterium]